MLASDDPGTSMPMATSSQRLPWEALPGYVRSGIEELLGDEVAAAASQPGGFSEGVAARLRLARGGKAFVKAASADAAPSVAGFHRSEIAVTRRLPPEAPVPRLLDAYDDGTWVALLFEEIDGRLPSQPWRDSELSLALSAAGRLSQVMTPAPMPDLVTAPRLGGWHDLCTSGNAGKLAQSSLWAYQHLDTLLALEDEGPEAIAGDTLLHGDMYPFNLMIGRGRVYVIDWPHAWVGAAYCDLLTLLSSASLSGIDPQPYAEAHPLTRDHRSQVNAFLALHAGFLLHRATSMPPTVDRNLVSMMSSLGLASLAWLQRRL